MYGSGVRGGVGWGIEGSKVGGGGQKKWGVGGNGGEREGGWGQSGVRGILTVPGESGD